MSQRYALLYDGACRICTSQIQTVSAYNRADLIEMLDMNDPHAQQRFPQVTPEMAQRELHLVAPDGQFYQGADAVRETLLRLPDLRGLGMLMGFPGVMLFARPLYGLIAANRYLLGGRVEPCDDGSCKR